MRTRAKHAVWCGEVSENQAGAGGGNVPVAGSWHGGASGTPRGDVLCALTLSVWNSARRGPLLLRQRTMSFGPTLL